MIKKIIANKYVSYLLILLFSLFRRKVYLDSEIFNGNALINYYKKTGGSSYHKDELTNHKKEYDLAVIVPCYNVVNYITECADSILSQNTHYNIQIIFVDDGSDDGTDKMLDDRYSKMPNVLVVHQKNGGLSNARNTGIALSSSKYITFIDSDDYLVNPYLFEELLDFAYKIDVHDKNIIFSYNLNAGNHKKVKYKALGWKKTNCITMKGYACGKVYSSSLFAHVCFPEKYWFEDTINSLVLFHIADYLYTTNGCGYVYRKHNQSITYKSKNNPRVLDTFYVTKQLLEDRKMLGLKYDDKYFIDSFMRQVVCNYKRLKFSEDKIQKSVFVETRNIILENAGSMKPGIRYKHVYNSLVSGDYNHYKLACELTN